MKTLPQVNKNNIINFLETIMQSQKFCTVKISYEIFINI